ncbi:prolipoprotein diacylglyceryl transferase [Oleiphilus messinensis]|uniref:Phosphatidylglycerol--prolipoprotein diacylglyceryl transferase n=1 Tax=Oleiphilus messinensis TaxID=141451 RepID=A0A1Y0IDR2_9GAMM|nr:prolipoprotein diacylglyceryl transferase [Oleiphilus messinensis]ARU58667.1 prolipoprotein diacylglyceryl transferase [Oleiphilus messinensis]
MLTYPQIDPVLVDIGPLKIHWYGIMYLIGFASAWYLGQKRAAQPWSPIKVEQVGDLIFYCALGVVLGGRLGYVFFYDFERFLDNPLWAIQVWKGGMSFHGGLVGVIVAMWFYSRSLGVRFFHLADYMAPLVPIGLGAGRLGNFIGAELYGRTTDLAVAMQFPIYQNIDGVRTLVGWTDPRHPSQLYQFALEGVALFTVLWLFSRKERPIMSVSGLFLFCYGLFRFLVEFVREPDAHLGPVAMGWMTMGQVLSTPMILIGLGLIVVGYRQHKSGTVNSGAV